MLRVLLFASLRDRAGWAERQMSISSDAITARDIWDQLEIGPVSSVRIAVNRQLVAPEQQLKSGDELAFLPPFTGG